MLILGVAGLFLPVSKLASLWIVPSAPSPLLVQNLRIVELWMRSVSNFNVHSFEKEIKITKMKDRPEQDVNTHVFFLSLVGRFSRTLCRVLSLRARCGF